MHGLLVWQQMCFPKRVQCPGLFCCSHLYLPLGEHTTHLACLYGAWGISGLHGGKVAGQVRGRITEEAELLLAQQSSPRQGPATWTKLLVWLMSTALPLRERKSGFSAFFSSLPRGRSMGWRGGGHVLSKWLISVKLFISNPFLKRWQCPKDAKIASRHHPSTNCSESASKEAHGTGEGRWQKWEWSGLRLVGREKKGWRDPSDDRMRGRECQWWTGVRKAHAEKAHSPGDAEVGAMSWAERG